MCGVVVMHWWARHGSEAGEPREQAHSTRGTSAGAPGRTNAPCSHSRSGCCCGRLVVPAAALSAPAFMGTERAGFPPLPRPAQQLKVMRRHPRRVQAIVGTWQRQGACAKSLKAAAPGMQRSHVLLHSSGAGRRLCRVRREASPKGHSVVNGMSTPGQPHLLRLGPVSASCNRHVCNSIMRSTAPWGSLASGPESGKRSPGHSSLHTPVGLYLSAAICWYIHCAY